MTRLIRFFASAALLALVASVLSRRKRPMLPLFDDIKARIESAAAIACDARPVRSLRAASASVPWPLLAFTAMRDIRALTSGRRGMPCARALPRVPTGWLVFVVRSFTRAASSENAGPILPTSLVRLAILEWCCT